MIVGIIVIMVVLIIWGPFILGGIDLFDFVYHKIRGKCDNSNEKTLDEVTLQCDINTLFFYELRKRGQKYVITERTIDINFVPNSVKDAVNEYIQERFDNWLLNIKNWGEQNKDIYAEALAAMPKLVVIYETLEVLFADQGEYITAQIEQEFFSKLPLICELIDDANKKVFDLANWESIKPEIEKKAITDLNKKEYNANVRTAFSKLDAMARLNSRVDLELLKTKYNKEKCGN